MEAIIKRNAAAFEHLPLVKADVVRLTYEQDLAPDEMAEISGTPYETVRLLSRYPLQEPRLEVAEPAAHAGRPVIAEKPLAITKREIERVVHRCYGAVSSLNNRAMILNTALPPIDYGARRGVLPECRPGRNSLRARGLS